MKKENSEDVKFVVQELGAASPKLGIGKWDG